MAGSGSSFYKMASYSLRNPHAGRLSNPTLKAGYNGCLTA